MTLLPLLAALLAAPTPAKPATASAEVAAAAAAQTARDEALQKAVDAVGKAADSAAKAADSAAKAAESASRTADKAAEVAARCAAPAAVVSAQAPAPAAAPPPPAAPWLGLLGANVVALTGNANTLVFSGKAAFDRKSEDWIVGFKTSAAYGQTTQAEVNQITALQGAAMGRLDRRFGHTISAFVTVGVDADHIKSIELRPLAELGVGLIWFDTKEGELAKSSLRTDLGFRYGRELRFQYFVDGKPAPLDLADVDIVAPHLGLAFRYAVSKDIIFTEDVEVSVNLVNEVRMMLSSQSKLSAKLTASTALTVQLGVLHDTAPATAGTKNTDTMLAIGFEVAL